MIAWVDASSPNTVSRGFERLAAKFSPKRVFADTDAKIEFVKDSLSRLPMAWLMVFDNFDQPDDFPSVVSFFPQASKGSILFTSRHAASERLGETVRVMGMTEQEAVELLLCQSKIERNDDNARVGDNIVRRLGYLPLAIDQAAAYISMRKLPLDLFLTHYTERMEAILVHTPPLWEYRRRLRDDKDETKLSVFTTWDLSFEQLSGEVSERLDIRHFLTIAAHYDVSRLGEGIFRCHYDKAEASPPWMQRFTTDGRWDQYKFQESVVELFQLSLLQNVEVAAAETVFSLHPLVADWLCLQNNGEQRRWYAEEAMAILQSYVETGDFDSLALARKLQVLSHVDAFLHIVEDQLNQPEVWASVLVVESALSFARVYDISARFIEASKLMLKALAASEKALGHHHLSTLNAVHDLGSLYLSQRKLAKAEEMCLRALTGREEVLGPAHRDTLSCVNLLGVCYNDRGELEKAEQLYQRALAGRKDVLGPAHRDTLQSVTNLGTLYFRRGNLSKAEEMYRRALAGMEEVIGPNNPDTLQSVDRLGSLPNPRRTC